MIQHSSRSNATAIVAAAACAVVCASLFVGPSTKYSTLAAAAIARDGGGLESRSSQAIAASEALSLTLEAQVGGAVFAASFDGTLAFAGVGQRVVRIDMADAAHPIVSGHSQLLGGLVTGIAVADTEVLVWGRLGSDAPLSNARAHSAVPPDSGPEGVLIVDGGVDGPLRTRGFYPSPQRVQAVSVDGNHAYVAAGTAGLRVVDFYNPDQPVELAVVDEGALISDARDVANVGDMVLVVDEAGGRLVSFDTTRPDAPRFLRALAFDGKPRAMDVTASHAFVSVEGGDSGRDLDGLAVVTISDPDQLLISGWADMVNPRDVAVDDAFAYVIEAGVYCGPATVVLVHLADPESPTVERNSTLVVRGARSLHSDAGIFTIARGDQGLDVCDSTAFFRGECASSLGLAAFATRLSVDDSEGYAHVINDVGFGLDIIESSMDYDMSPAGRWDEWPWTDASLTGIAVDGDRAYVAYGQNCESTFSGLYVLDISDYRSVALLAEMSLGIKIGAGRDPGSSTAVRHQGGYAYVADDSGWLSVVDVSAPMTPTRTGIVDFGREAGATANDVAVSGAYAFVATYRYRIGSAVAVVNIADPSAPYVAQWLPTPNTAISVATDGGVLYAAVTDYGILSWDISDPGNPRPLGANSSLNVMSVSAADGLVYAVAYPPVNDAVTDVPLARLLWVLDAAEPTRLPELARLWLLDPIAVTALGDKVFVASGNGGLVRIGRVRSGNPVPTATAGPTRTPRVTSTRPGTPDATPTRRPSVTPMPGQWQLALPWVSG